MSTREVVFSRDIGDFLVIHQGRCRSNGVAKNAFTYTTSLQQATTFDHDSVALINELLRSLPKTNGHGFSETDAVDYATTVQVTRKVQVVHGNYQPLSPIQRYY